MPPPTSAPTHEATPAFDAGTRPTKREAAMAAALTVFARDGYDAASMAQIAREAGVAKPTLYNHFEDKADLFAAALEEYAARSGARVQAVIEGLDPDAADLRTEFERVGHALLACVRSPEGRSLLRLQAAEEVRFPELIGAQRTDGRRRVLDALTGKIARLALARRLQVTDPGRAARHLMALVLDEPLNAVGNGFATPPDAVFETAVREGVDTFLAAFGPR